MSGTRINYVALFQFIGYGQTKRDIRDLHIRKVLPGPEAYRSGKSHDRSQAEYTERRTGITRAAHNEPSVSSLTSLGYDVRTNAALSTARAQGLAESNGRDWDSIWKLTPKGWEYLQERTANLTV